MIDMANLIDRARAFAEHVHAGQTRKYSGEPYVMHLREVAGYCADVGCRDEVIAAAWLHDAKEDQGVTHDELVAAFGDDVAQLVDEVTNQSCREDPREKRKSVDREHLARASPEGKTIKLADLISNTRNIAERDPQFAVAYMREKRLLMPLLAAGNTTLYLRAVAILETYYAWNITKRLRVHAKDFRLESSGRFAAELDEAADEIDRLRAALNATLSPEELRLIDKHCDWVAFQHAWNAIMKRRREAISATADLSAPH